MQSIRRAYQRSFSRLRLLDLEGAAHSPGRSTDNRQPTQSIASRAKRASCPLKSFLRYAKKKEEDATLLVIWRVAQGPDLAG